MASGRGVRIAAGSAKGMPLAEPRGVRLRPTSGLVREAIFNILGDLVTDAKVLDLYAGTGALGIEALSRGAAHATFVEAEPPCVQAITQSLSRGTFSDIGTVIRGRLPGALKGLPGPFQIIFMDPPYNEPDTDSVLLALAPLLADGGMVVYEHGSRYNPPERPEGMRLSERRVYGDSAIAFFVAQEGE